MHFVVGYHHIIPAEECLNGCRPRKDLAQRVKPMLPSMNLDCRAVLVVVGQTGRNKIAPAHHLVILDESVSMILKFLPDFWTASSHALMLACYYHDDTVYKHYIIVYIYMIVYQHIIHLWVLIIKKKHSPWTDFHLLSQPSQLLLLGFATFGMDTYIVQNSSAFFAGSPFLHQDDGALWM